MDDYLEQQYRAELDASDFVMLTNVVPDALLEIRYYSTYNFIGDRIDGYREPCAYLTREAAEGLRKASEVLKKHEYVFKVYDAYRPHTAVEHFIRWAEDTQDVRMKKYFYPDVDKKDLFRLGYIAARSGHSKGSTVDLTLFDMNTGVEVDMGSHFDYFGDESHPDYRGDLTQKQIDNRMFLRDLMTDNGFLPIDCEWWHFTLADEPYPDTFFSFPIQRRTLKSKHD